MNRTMKEMYELVIEVMTKIEDGVFEDYPTEAIKTFCTKEIGKLDKRTEASRAKREEKKANNPYRDFVLEAAKTFTEGLVTAETVHKLVEEKDPEGTVAKTRYWLGYLASNGFIQKADISVKGESGKKKTVKGYGCITEA